MDWFEFWLNVLALAGQSVLQLFFVSRIANIHMRIRNFLIYFLLLYFICTMIPTRYNYIGIPINLLLMYAMIRFMLKGSRSTCCVLAVMTVYVSQLSFGLIGSLLMLMPLGVQSSILLCAMAILPTLLALTLCYGGYWLIFTRFSLKDIQNENTPWLLLPPCLFLFAIELYLLSTNYGNVSTVPAPIEAQKHLTLFTLQALGLLVLFSSLYAYQRVCAGFRAQTALVSMTQEVHAQKVYVAEAQARYENTRAFRHDIKNHLSVIHGLLKAGNIEQAQIYLQKLAAATEELSFPFSTGKPVVDILLENKLALCTANGIELDVSITLPSSCTLTDLDWCVIFANALDNAIQACMGKPDGVRGIHILGERQGDFYMLEFENTCRRESPWVPKFGIGLNNIKTVAEKYGGSITAEYKNERFLLNILLNISIQPDDISIHMT